jgi:hypothetical protein
MAIPPKAIYMFNEIPIKIPMAFCMETEKPTVKYIWKHKKTSNSQSNSEQKVQWWRHHNTQPQNTLQSHNSRSSMVLVQTQTGKTMDQNRISKCKPI